MLLNFWSHLTDQYSHGLSCLASLILYLTSAELRNVWKWYALLGYELLGNYFICCEKSFGSLIFSAWRKKNKGETVLDYTADSMSFGSLMCWTIITKKWMLYHRILRYYRDLSLIDRVNPNIILPWPTYMCTLRYVSFKKKFGINDIFSMIMQDLQVSDD